MINYTPARCCNASEMLVNSYGRSKRLQHQELFRTRIGGAEEFKMQVASVVGRRSWEQPDQKETQPWLRKFMESNGASWQTSINYCIGDPIWNDASECIGSRDEEDRRRKKKSDHNVCTKTRQVKSMRWFDRQETVFKTVTTS
jgi:hypothetical protein